MNSNRVSSRLQVWIRFVFVIEPQYGTEAKRCKSLNLWMVPHYEIVNRAMPTFSPSLSAVKPTLSSGILGKLRNRLKPGSECMWVWGYNHNLPTSWAIHLFTCWLHSFRLYIFKKKPNPEVKYAKPTTLCLWQDKLTFNRIDKPAQLIQCCKARNICTSMFRWYLRKL